MLCAKNLKVALAAILGVVGLMGAGTAHAAIKLVPENATAADRMGHAPQYFAAERLAADSSSTSTLVMVSATSSGFNVDVPEISAGLEADTTYYIRFDLLEGNGFTGRNSASGSNATDEPIAIAFNNSLLSGSVRPQLIAGADTYNGTVLNDHGRREAVVYSFEVGSTAIARNGGRLAWVVADSAGFEVGLGSPTEEKTYYLRMSIWSSRDAADTASGRPIWQAANTIVMTKTTLSTAVQDPREITATVTSNFRRFIPVDRGAGATGATTATQGKLATATVTFANTVTVGSGTSAVTHEVRDHRNGNQIAIANVLDKVTATVTGNNGTDSYSFGEFYLGPYDAATGCSAAANRMTRNAPETDDMDSMVTPKATSTASLSRALTAAAVGAELEAIPPGQANAGAMRARFVFCANVTANTEEQMPEDPQWVYQRIEEVAYNMVLGTELVRHTGTQGMANGASGTIDRDGTEVRLAYLTNTRTFGGTRTWQDGAMGGYNQRLVIVNHGTTAVTYTLGDFAPEADRTVMAQEMAEGEIAPKSSVVLRVSDLIQIMEDGEVVSGRTSAVLTLVGAADDISVATTQVTLPEGQTDTVSYHPR